MDKNEFELLNHIWNRQELFNKNFTTDKNPQDMTKEYSLHLITEVNSLLETINWKIHHKKDTVSVNRRDLILEWIDIYKYWLSIGLLWGITPEEFYQYFNEKSELVEQRYLQEYLPLEGKEIVIFDIDGVLSDYPKTFLNYIESEEDTKIDTELIDNLDIYKYLEGRIPTEKIKSYKDYYRKSGMIRNEKVNEGAVELTKLSKEKGYYNIMLTSRPFDTYKNLYLDTFMWLKENGFVFDALISDSKKRDKINNIAKTSRIKAVIDDDPRIVNGLLGLDSVNRIYLLHKYYNKDYNPETDKVKRVYGFEEISKEL